MVKKNMITLTDEQYGVALNNGVSKQTVNYRVRKLGWEIERAITTPVKDMRNKQPSSIGVSEEQFAIAESNGVSRSTVYNRVVSLKWSIEDAINKKIKHSKNPMLEIADRNGISNVTYYKRLKAGIPPMIAATTPVHKSQTRRSTEKVRNYIQTAINNEIPLSMYYRRIRIGWDKVSASSLPITDEEKLLSI